MYLSGRAAYDDESPRQIVVFDEEVVPEETDDAGHNGGRDELSKPEKMKGERVIWGWVLGYLRGRHLDLICLEERMRRRRWKLATLL